MQPDDPYFSTPDGRDRAAALCAKYGVSSLPQVWFVKEAEDDGTHPDLGILLELAAAVRAEEQARAELASTVACPYCPARAGQLCIRKRGRFAGQRLGGFAERLASPFRPVNHHRARYSAAMDARLRTLTEP